LLLFHHIRKLDIKEDTEEDLVEVAAVAMEVAMVEVETAVQAV
jgi:hypothetical protein